MKYLKFEEFMFELSFIDNKPCLFENGNYMDYSEIKLLSEFLLEIIKKENKMTKTKKKPVATKPAPKKTIKKKK